MNNVYALTLEQRRSLDVAVVHYLQIVLHHKLDVKESALIAGLEALSSMILAPTVDHRYSSTVPFAVDICNMARESGFCKVYYLL